MRMWSLIPLLFILAANASAKNYLVEVESEVTSERRVPESGNDFMDAAPCVRPLIWQPVCSERGKTYGNEWALRCEEGKNAKRKCKGKCPCEGAKQKPTPYTSKPGCPCPKILRPVCSTDGETFPNECELKCKGADKECEGDCPCNYPNPTTPKPGPFECSLNCSLDYRPVCNQGEVTIFNECRLKCAYGKKECDGECPCNGIRTKPCLTYCPNIALRVCSEDGETFFNECELNCKGAKKKCNGRCPCPHEERKCICDRMLMPVCGQDGKTYDNKCEMDCANVSKKCEGVCPCWPKTYHETKDESLEEV